MERKQYAMTAVAFLMGKLEQGKLEKIRTVILFGSVAAGTATEKSDVDLFFDVPATLNEQKEIKKTLEKAASDFYLSQEGLKFKMIGMENQVSVYVGKVEEWKELQSSMEGSAIVLYGRYFSNEPVQKHHEIIYWESPKSLARGAFLNKIYGYRVGKRAYPGLIEKLGGSKIGKSAAIIPVQKRAEFIQTLDKYRVDYKIVDMESEHFVKPSAPQVNRR